MRRQKVITTMLLTAGTILLAGVLTLGFTGVAYSWQSTGQLHVIKTDGVGVPLLGAGFTLFTVGSNGSPGSATAWSCSMVKLDGGVADCSTSDQVTPGTYWVVETTVPPGYSAGAPQKVTIGKMLVTTVTFKDDPLAGSIVITKTSTGGQPVSGAGFTLYLDNNGVPGASTGKSCMNTGIVAGVATCTISPVAAGTYWVKETTVPAGFVAAGPWKVSVGAGQKSAVTVTDTPKPPTTTTTTSTPPTTTTTSKPPTTTTTSTPPTTTTTSKAPGTTTTTQPPTGPSGGTTTTVIPGIGPLTPLTGVTTVETGLPFAGSKLLVIALGSLGLAMIVTALFLRRRFRASAIRAGDGGATP